MVLLLHLVELRLCDLFEDLLKVCLPSHLLALGEEGGLGRQAGGVVPADETWMDAISLSSPSSTVAPTRLAHRLDQSLRHCTCVTVLMQAQKV